MDASDGYRPELKGMLQRSYARVKGNPKAMDYGQKQLRAQSLASKLRTHIQKNKHNWVAAEARKLNRQIPQHHRFTRAGGPKPPPGAVPSKTIRAERIEAMAYTLVHARCQKRMENIRNLAWSRNQVSKQSQSHNRSRSRTRS
ncbi:MAG: hypothetical protein AAGH41_02685 [Pseudomonadota bacterium]